MYITILYIATILLSVHMDDGNLAWINSFPRIQGITAGDIPLHGRECGNAIVELHVVSSANVYNNPFVSLLNRT